MTTSVRETQLPKRFALGELLAFLTGIGVAFASLFVDGVNPDVATGYLLLFLLAPVGLIRWPRRRTAHHRESGTIAKRMGFESTPTSETKGWAGWFPWMLAIIVGVASFSASACVGRQFGDLPPAYHDEYSYIFQAKTFLAGRLSYPSHSTAPELFDQMHVLNEGRFVSRYFPGTGAWIAPFLAMGHPYWGHWLAGAIVAVLIFWTGRELGGNGVGLVAGLLTALSPGMVLFSNLLLSHHPTLVGLSLFLFTFLRMMRTGSAAYGLLAGIGLSYAMLCRPMTAAGVGLPFGIWFLWRLCRNDANFASNWRQRVQCVAALGSPILAGMLIMAGYNLATTGGLWTTPYQLYTDLYTPRHVYGFNNVVRGEAHLGPKVIDNYDRWAVNLTPGLAAENVFQRLMASWHWTLGIVPLAVATVIFFVCGLPRVVPWGMTFAAIVSLHAAHVPYWYVGIMGWHYVFESGPLWALIFAGVSVLLLKGWREADRPLMPVWWSLVVALTFVSIYVPLPSFETASSSGAGEVRIARPSLIQLGIGNIAFSRHKYADFRQVIERGVEKRPALVLVRSDPSDRHIDYVVNDPALADTVLIGRYDPVKTNLDKVHAEFPDRTIYLFDATAWTLKRLP